MPHFGRTSRERLLGCDSRLISVCSELIMYFDFSVISGHRTNEEQDALFAQGRTAPGRIVTYKRGGESTHNTYPSRAIDLAPYRGGVVWDDEGLFAEIAARKGIELQWGGHWPNFKDRPHFECPSRD